MAKTDSFIYPSKGVDISERNRQTGGFRSPGKRFANPHIVPELGKHVIWKADSSTSHFGGCFDLVLCSPPYFHPQTISTAHGVSPATPDLEGFAEWTARVLFQASQALKPGRPVCFVKTDVKYKRTLLPIGFRIAERTEKLGLPVRAHWIWQRLCHYSPYAPSFSNIFILGDCRNDSLRHNGLFRSNDCRSRKFPSSFTPDLFRQLLLRLARRRDCVLDPFAGLGSTTIAAMQCGQWSVGVELSEDQIANAKHLLAGFGAVEFRMSD